MKKKIFTFFLALVAGVGTMSAAITVRLDPSSCSSWSTVSLWAWTDNGNIFDSWPGQIVSKDSEGWYSYTFDESITSVNIIWNNGTDQTVNIEGVTSSTCYALNSTTGTQITANVVNCGSGSSQGGTPVSGKYKIGDLYYNLDATNKTAEVTSQNSIYPYWSTTITTANIPSSVTYNSVSYSVTSIGNMAFIYCSSLTSVTIPNSVTSIGNMAFCECSRLTSPVYNAHAFAFMPTSYSGAYTIPDGIKSIAGGAFCGCSSLTSVTIPNSVTSIGNMAFIYCSSLTSVTIPNSVTSIGNQAFIGCTGLTSVTIPNSVTSIGNQVFYNCSSLTSINVETNNPNYCSVEGVLFNKDKTRLIQYPGGKQGAYTIPNSVTSIGEHAFYGCIGLTSVTIPNSVTSIRDNAFYECSGLTSLSVDAGNTVYDSRNNCNAIIETATNTLIFGSKNTTIPNSVTSIGDVAFARCSGLTSVTIPNSVTSIGESAFYECSGLTSVTIPNSVTSIGESAFRNCSSLTSITIPNSITSIGMGAFYSCSGLKNVILGTSVKVLEAEAFAYCSSIETITCYSQRPPTVNQDALYGLDYSTIVYVPADYLNTYKMHDAWGLYDVRPLGAAKVETEELTITPSDNTVDIVWPTITGATTYELIIRDTDGDIVCTLIFNAQGHLTQIDFAAPARTNAPEQTQTAGFAFTVTGLNSVTTYNYTITSKDVNGKVLDTKTGTFTTDGIGVATNLEHSNTNADKKQSIKVIHNGNVYILNGGNTYNLQGMEVK